VVILSSTGKKDKIALAAMDSCGFAKFCILKYDFARHTGRTVYTYYFVPLVSLCF